MLNSPILFELTSMNRDRKKSWRAAGLLSGLLLAVAVSGCSTFSRDWKAAASRPLPPAGIEGRWQGTWLSHSNGHTGSLRALITQTQAGAYETRFHATFWKIFSSEYTVHLHAAENARVYQLQGREDIGRFLCWRLGEYSYDATVTPTNFSATYRSAADGGVFQMSRP